MGHAEHRRALVGLRDGTPVDLVHHVTLREQLRRLYQEALVYLVYHEPKIWIQRPRLKRESKTILRLGFRKLEQLRTRRRRRRHVRRRDRLVQLLVSVSELVVLRLAQVIVLPLQVVS